MRCQAETREQASVRYLRRIVESGELQSRASTQFRLGIEAGISRRGVFFQNCLINPYFPLQSPSSGTAKAPVACCLLTRCCHAARHFLSAHRAQKAKCQAELMQTQRTMGAQCPGWQEAAGDVTAKEGSCYYDRPPGMRGTDNHHGNRISAPTPDHVGERGAGRGEVGVLKTEQRWQLPLQSWWDKVISLSCCNWWAAGWSNFTSFFRRLGAG